VPLRVQGRSVEADHLLLGPTDEVAAPRLLREPVERLAGRKRVGKQQTPQKVIGIVLAHVRRRRQQQEMRCRPVQRPALTIGAGAPDGFREPVAVRLPYAEIGLPMG
jgi:hypothetical protein